MCPCEEHRIWHWNHQTMHRTSTSYSQHPCWRSHRCSSWISKHHWRNETHEGCGPEESMVRHPTRSIYPGAPDRCGWALGRSNRRFRIDVRCVQRISQEWFEIEYLHWEPHKMPELRKQLDKSGDLRYWWHWDGWIFTGCKSSCKIAQHLQWVRWLERDGSREGPPWIPGHCDTCNAFRIQDYKRCAQAGITSRCHPNACIHGEREMQTRPVTPVHCTTWNSNRGLRRRNAPNAMVLQTALGWWKRRLSWLHEDRADQGGDRINDQSNCNSWVCRRHFRILAWNAWSGYSIPYYVRWMGGKPWQLPRRTGRVVLAIQQFMSTYRHHQHKAKPIQESIHPAGREWHGDYNLERSRNFWPTHAEEDHQNAGAPRSQLRWPPWNDWGLIKRWRGGWSWWTWWGDHDAYGAGPSSRTNFRRNRCRSWWHRDWGGGRWHGGTTFGGEEAPNWGAGHPWSIWEADFRCLGCSILFHLWWKTWHWRMYYTRWWEHEGHHMAHEVDHGSEVQIPIIIRKIQSCNQRQKRQAPKERHATRKALGKNQIHWERGSDQVLLQSVSLYVRHWWSWRRRTILSEWCRSQPN